MTGGLSNWPSKWLQKECDTFLRLGGLQLLRPAPRTRRLAKITAVPSQHAFVTLDGLRGIAAIAILTRHAPAFFGTLSTFGANASGKLIAVGPFYESYLAVDFFFMLSGFVLAHAYAKRLQTSMTALQFMTIRLIRLYPLYLFALALSLVTNGEHLLRGDMSLLTITASALFFLPSPVTPTGALFPLNGPAWSLFGELVVNFAFAVLARLMNTPRLIILVLSSGALLVISVIQKWFGFHQHGTGALDAGSEWQSFLAGPIRAEFAFFAGVLVYRLWSSRPRTLRIPPLFVAAVLVAVLSAHPLREFEVAFDLSATLIIFPVLIFVGATSRPRLLVRTFSMLGTASYGIYVLQIPLYFLVRDAMRRIVNGDSHYQLPLVTGIVFAAFVLVVALLLDYLYDFPIRRRLMQAMPSKN